MVYCQSLTCDPVLTNSKEAAPQELDLADPETLTPPHFRHHFTYTFSSTPSLYQRNLPKEGERDPSNLRNKYPVLEDVTASKAPEAAGVLGSAERYRAMQSEIRVGRSAPVPGVLACNKPLAAHRAINTLLVQSPDFPGLLAVLRQAPISELNCVNLCTVCSRLAKMVPRPGPPDLKPLLQEVTARVGQLMGELFGRQLSVVAHAFAKLGAPDADLFTRLADRALLPAVLQTFGAQDVANMAWAYASGGHLDRRLLVALAQKAQEPNVISAMKARELANIAWAFATLGHTDPALMHALATRAATPGVRGALNAQDIANTSWAFAALAIPDAALFDTLADVLLTTDVLSTFTAQAVSSTAWAFATLRINHTAVMQLLAQRAVHPKVISALNGYGLVNLCWSYACLDLWNEEFMRLMANRALEAELLEALSPQNVVRLAWAFARLDVLHVPLMEALAAVTLRPTMYTALSSQNLTDLVWAYATLGVPHPQLLSAVADFAASPDVCWCFSAQDLVGLLSSFAKLRFPHALLLEAMAGQTIRPSTLKDLGPGDLTSLLSSYTALGHQTPQLFHVLVHAALDAVSELDVRQLAVVVGAAEATGFPLDRLVSDVSSRLQEVDAEGSPATLYALAQLLSWTTRVTPLPRAMFWRLMQLTARPHVLRHATAEGVGDFLAAYRLLAPELPEVLAALCRQLPLCASPTALEGVARLARLAVDLQIKDLAVFQWISTQVLRRVETEAFPPAVLADLAWAFAVADVDDQAVLRGILSQAPRALPRLTGTDAFRLVSAAAKFKVDDGAALPMLAAHLSAPPVLPSLQVPELVGTLWALATLDALPPAVLLPFADRCRALLPQLSKPQALTLLWALHRARAPVPDLLRALKLLLDH